MRDSAPLIVRRATLADTVFLPEIERSAARAFRVLRDLGWTPCDFVESVEEHAASIARGTLWVAEADGNIVGFLTADIKDAELHIDEFDVQLEYQRRGIGRLLLAAAVDFARDRGFEALTLTTFLGVPWNEPFYKSVGFQVVDKTDLSARLQAILDLEAEQGLPRKKRCAMRMTFRS